MCYRGRMGVTSLLGGAPLSFPCPPWAAASTPPLAWAALCCLGGSSELSILMEGGMSLGVAPKCPLPSSGETAGAGRWTGVGEFQPSQQFGIINHQGAPGKKQKVFGKIC